MALILTMQHVFLTLVFFLTLVSSALAQGTQANLKAAGLASTCANCHGIEGTASINSVVPSLNLFTADYIKTNLMWFKTGQRPATVMTHIAKGYTDEQIDLIANYFGKKN